jgi:hypothetical protein
MTKDLIVFSLALSISSSDLSLNPKNIKFESEFDRPRGLHCLSGLGGANSTVFFPLEEVEPKALKIGMKVALEWEKEPKVGWKNLKYFKPDQG